MYIMINILKGKIYMILINYNKFNVVKFLKVLLRGLKQGVLRS